MKTNSKMLIISISLLAMLVGAVLITGCIQTNPPSNPQNNSLNTSSGTSIGNNTTGDKSMLQVTVIDKTTKRPIEDAIVYLGTGYWKCHTDTNGKCSINGFPWGDYALGVFKRGHKRYVELTHFKKGDNLATVELEKKSKFPETITITGTVIKIITAKGSKSENQYYKIKTSDGAEEYIFDEIGMNRGFDKFVNKTVKITGFRETGFIGWQGEQVEGIYVENITEVETSKKV